MKLVDNWRSSWKWFSLQTIAAGGVVQLSFIAMPAELRAYIPDTWMHWVAVGTLATAALGRFIDQSKTNAS